MNIQKLKELLYKIYSPDTCYSNIKNNWNKNNPSLGHCAITSLIVNDYFNGKILRCKTKEGTHYYNLIDDKVIDLTVEQFQGKIPDYRESEEKTREEILENNDTIYRYKLLKERLSKIYNHIQ